MIMTDDEYHRDVLEEVRKANQQLAQILDALRMLVHLAREDKQRPRGATQQSRAPIERAAGDRTITGPERL